MINRASVDQILIISCVTKSSVMIVGFYFCAV